MQVSEAARLVVTPDGKKRLEVGGRALFELNAIGAIIWEKLTAKLSSDEIARGLAATFNVAEDRAAGDVADFIELLKEYLLIDDDPDLPAVDPRRRSV
jgi:hypothetical protein